MKQLADLVDQGKASPAFVTIGYAFNGDMDEAVKWFQRAYKEKDANLATEGFFFPERFTNDPAIIAQFDLPGMKEMFDIRRANWKKYQDSKK